MFDFKNNCNLWINELIISVYMKCYVIFYKYVIVYIKKLKFLWDIFKYYIVIFFFVEEFV